MSEWVSGFVCAWSIASLLVVVIATFWWRDDVTTRLERIEGLLLDREDEEDGDD